jgi:hypothetical protein
MKITIEQIIKKVKNKTSPLIALLYSKEIKEEVVRIIFSQELKCFLISRETESIKIPFNQEFEIDCMGGFDFIHNNKQHSIIIMVPLMEQQ